MLSLKFVPKSTIETFENGNNSCLTIIYNDDEPNFDYEQNKDIVKELYHKTQIHSIITELNDKIANCLDDNISDEYILDAIKGIKEFDKNIFIQLIIAIHGLLEARNINECTKFMNEIKMISTTETENSSCKAPCIGEGCDALVFKEQSDIYNDIEKSNTPIDIENEEEE